MILFFFFSSRRRYTRWPRDWSSDVCSSDLLSTCHSSLLFSLPNCGTGEYAVRASGMKRRSKESQKYVLIRSGSGTKYGESGFTERMPCHVRNVDCFERGARRTRGEVAGEEGASVRRQQSPPPN